MSLRDEVQAITHRGCPLFRLKQTVEPNEYLEIAECVYDPTLSPTALSKVLEKRGYELPEQSIRRHRQGQCKVCNGS